MARYLHNTRDGISRMFFIMDGISVRPNVKANFGQFILDNP
jgi:hypothetical protein